MLQSNRKRDHFITNNNSPMKKISIHRRNMSNFEDCTNYLGIQINSKNSNNFKQQNHNISTKPLVKSEIGRSLKVLPNTKQIMNLGDKSVNFMTHDNINEGVYHKSNQLHKVASSNKSFDVSRLLAQSKDKLFIIPGINGDRYESSNPYTQNKISLIPLFQKFNRNRDLLSVRTSELISSMK